MNIKNMKKALEEIAKESSRKNPDQSKIVELAKEGLK